MNNPFFASVVGRWVAPAVLAATTFAGTLGFSSVASAQERVRVGVAAPRVVVEQPFVAPHRRVVVREPGVIYEPGYAPYYGGYYGGYAYGPGWGRDFGHRGWGGGWGGGYGRFPGHGGAPGGHGMPGGGHAVPHGGGRR